MDEVRLGAGAPAGSPVQVRPIWEMARSAREQNVPRIVVTGGAGFIGSHLVAQLLSDGAEVVVVDDLSSGNRSRVPAGVRFIQASVLDFELMCELLAGADACVHLAAVASVEVCTKAPLASHNVNVGGFLTLLEAVRRGGRETPVIYASSAAVYGQSSSASLNEADLPSPASAYGADKLACEHHAKAAYGAYGIRSTGLRFFNVFGVGQDPASPYSGVISRFMQLAQRGETIEIQGDGEQTRDFVHISDVVDAITICIKLQLRRRGAGAEVYNVCTGRPHTINQLMTFVGQLYGFTSSPRLAPARTNDVRHSVGEPAKAGRELGFHARTDLYVGLAELKGAGALSVATAEPATLVALS